jgi:hypothetical protein
MSKLSDAQLLILSAAAQRANMLALPLPKSLRGGAAQKVVAALLRQGLLEEIDADTRIGEPIWRETGDGHGVTLAITSHGLAAIDIEPEAGGNAPTGAGEPQSEEPAGASSVEPEATPKTRPPREGTKQAKLIAMLRAEGGATIEEIVAALNWRAHTVRGAMAGAIKKKLGLDVTSEKIVGRGRVYKLDAA